MTNHYSHIYNRDNSASGPHGWIQWKGTDVCMDVYCSCGHHGHFDGEFFYYYECPECHTKYAVGQIVKLIPLTPEQVAYVTPDGFKTTEIDDDDEDC